MGDYPAPRGTVKLLAPLIPNCDYLDKVSAEVQVCIKSYWQPNHKIPQKCQHFRDHIWKKYKILGQTPCLDL